MVTYIGLYYPFIRFKNEAWLKLMALYWDKMARIVPTEYGVPHDSDAVKQLGSELGFIKNVPPGDQSELGYKFLQLLQQHNEDLVGKYGTDGLGTWLVDPITKTAAPKHADPRLAYIFNEKMPLELRDALVETHLAIPHQGDDERWIGMHPKLASVYMSALAEEIAGEYGYRPVTDETYDHLAVVGCTLERLAQALLGDVSVLPPKLTEQEIEEQLASIALETVIPEDIARIPTEKIIKIRKKYLAELEHFQEYIHSIATDLKAQEIGDAKHLQEHIEIVLEKKIKPAVAEVKTILNYEGIKTWTGAMCISTSLPLMTLLAPSGPLALVPALAVGAIGVWVDHQKAAKGAVQRDAAFLVRLEKGLAPNKLLSQVVSAAKSLFSAS